MPHMTRIPSDLHRFGLKVELVPGWETRGSSSFAPAAVVDHWTAGPRGTLGRPSLNVCINGRPGISGPLANIYLARDGTCVVIAAGRANHAGVGGFRDLVGNSAVYGIEAESGGDGDWTPEQLAAYPRLNAALLSGLGRDASWLCGHHIWAPTRKIDIRDIFPAVQAQTAAILANPIAPEDDMPTPADVSNAIANRPIGPRPGNPKDSMEAYEAWLDSAHYAYAAAQRIAALTTAVDRLAVAVGKQQGVDVEELRAAIREEMAKVVDVRVSVAGSPAA